MDEKFFKDMQKLYEFNQEIYSALTADGRAKYLFNYFQWKQIEATETGEMKLAEQFYQCKQEIQKCCDPVYIKEALGVKKVTDDLYNKFIVSTVKKLKIELDFL